MIKIGLIGAGNRCIDYNLPVLKAFEDKAEVCGVLTRSGRIRNKDFKLKANNVATFSTFEDLQKTKPDLIWITVPVEQNLPLLVNCLRENIPTLIETPISFNPQVLLRIRDIVGKQQSCLGIIEQWPWLPLEQFKKKIIDSGELGQIIVAENDYRTYDYHGIAQLRRYLPDSPIQTINIASGGSQVPPHFDLQNNLVKNAQDHWRIITATLQDGSILINKYSSLYKKVPYRISKGLRIYGTRGTVMSGCLVEGGPVKISVLDEEGNTHNLDVQIESAEGIVQTISTTLPNNEKLVWTNEYCLQEHQTGIAKHLDAMISRVEGDHDKVLYSIEDVIRDMFTLNGIKP